MHFFHRILLLVVSLLTLTSAWRGSRKQDPVTSPSNANTNKNTNANTALAAITALHTEHKARMTAHEKTMLPYSTRLSTLFASLHIDTEDTSETTPLNLNTLLELITDIIDVAVDGKEKSYDHDIESLKKVLLEQGGVLEERLWASRGNKRVLEEARRVLRDMATETERLRIWNEGFRGRVEGVKGVFEKGRRGGV